MRKLLILLFPLLLSHSFAGQLVQPGNSRKPLVPNSTRDTLSDILDQQEPKKERKEKETKRDPPPKEEVRSGIPTPPYKIGIIDSGYDPSRALVKLKLCKDGHYDYFTDTPNINYVHIHGTWVGDIIADKLKDVDYCAVIYQIGLDVQGHSSPEILADAVALAISEGVIALNVSYSEKSDPAPVERKAFQELSKMKIATFIAAGNNSQDLDQICDVYPACYKGKYLVTVGRLDEDDPKHPAKKSNYGKKVDVWAQGLNYTGEESGTSFAAPRALSEYILFLEHKRLAATK